MVRIATAAVTVQGTCDHCKEGTEAVPPGAEPTITLVTLHRGTEVAYTARFCERHFLLFSDLVSDQVAALLYPKRAAPA